MKSWKDWRDWDFASLKVLVIGDVMLDLYWEGLTERISPEAPVPVVHVKNKTHQPGGAANVACNLSRLGVQVTLLGAIGDDSTGALLQNYLNQASTTAHLKIQMGEKTITKTRILSKFQQLLRLDEEDLLPFEPDYWQPIYQRLLPEMDVIILSDYAKGMLMDPQFWIQPAKAAEKIIFVDPKQADWSVYKGATAITPNLKELKLAQAFLAPEVPPEASLETLLTHCEIEKLILTKSEEGIALIEKNASHHFKSQVKQVFDVTGAGDTVLATLAAFVGLGFSWIQATEYANCAAGIVVGKLGTAAVTPAELESAIRLSKTTGAQTLPQGVVAQSEAELLEWVHLARRNGEKIIFTNGCFDILHAGHVLYLNQARALGDRLIVAVNADSTVSRLKGQKRPINQLDDRLQVLAGLRAVDWIIAFEEPTPERLIELVQPDVLVKGGDYSDLNALPGAEFMLSQGKEVKILDLKPGCSTSKIIDKLLT